MLPPPLKKDIYFNQGLVYDSSVAQMKGNLTRTRTRKITQEQKSAKLRAEAPDEIPAFVRAAKTLNKMNGISASGTIAQRDSIREALSFSPATAEGKELKRNILKMADAFIPDNGLFFID